MPAVQVLPYNAYRDSAVLRLAAAPDRVSAEMLLATQDSSNELARVRNTLKHLRSSTYMHLDTVGAFTSEVLVSGLGF